MAVDLSEFYAKPPRKCLVGKFIEGLPDKDREIILAAIDTPDITAASIHKACERRGANFGTNTLRVHCRGECLCARI